MFEESKVEEAITSAKSLNCSVERALVMLGHASENTLKPIREAQEMVKGGKISLEMAVKALRFAQQNNLDLAEAISVLNSVHQKTQVLPAVGNAFSQLLLEAAMINAEQLRLCLQKSGESGMTLGRILVFNRDISSWMMASALHAHLLVRDGKISKQHAITGLQAVGRRRITIEQALFELGLYRETPGQTVRIGELFRMAGLITESDMLECLEIELVKEKLFGQILLEQGHATHPLLEAAIYLQDMVSNDTIRAYQAAEALKVVRKTDVSVYQAVAELQPPPQLTPPHLKFIELIAKSAVVTTEQMSEIVDPAEDSSVRAGKKLLSAGLVNEVMLYTALRTFSLLREGYISNENAVNVLQYCGYNNVSVDDALLKLGLNIPSRLQWLWT